MFTGFRVQGSGLRVQGFRVMAVCQGHIGNVRGWWGSRYGLIVDRIYGVVQGYIGIEFRV